MKNHIVDILFIVVVALIFGWAISLWGGSQDEVEVSGLALPEYLDELDEFDKAIEDRTHIAAEFGYCYGTQGYSEEEMLENLDKILKRAKGKN